SAMWAVGRNKEMLAISVVRIVLLTGLSWLLIAYWQQHFGNGAIILVIISGITELPVVVACLALLPKGAVGAPVLLNLFKACLTGILAVLTISVFMPLPLWALTPLYIVVLGAAGLGTGLVSPSDARFAMEVARSKIFGAPKNESLADG